MPKYVTPRAESEIVLTATTSVLTNTADDSFFISLKDWPNKAIIDRVTIAATTDSVTGPLDILILSDPAAYRAASTPATEDYVLAAWYNETGEPGPNTSWKIDERYAEGIYVNDATLSNSLHLYFKCVDVGGNTLSNSTAFNIKIYGRPVFDMENYFNRQHIYHEVEWNNDISVPVWTDLTINAKNVTDIRNSSMTFNMVTATSATQQFYVGAFNKFTRVYFDVATPNTTQIDLTAEYYRTDGTWQPLTIFDCTDDTLNNNPYTMSYSGLIYWTEPSQWERLLLDDSLGVPPDAVWQFGAGLPRYYVRFSLGSIATNPAFYSIRILPEILSHQI